MARNRYLVTYDVAEDKRRNMVHRTLRNNGDHVQFSVFLCELNDRELQALKEDLTKILNHREDQVLVLNIGPASAEISARIEWLGKSYQPPMRVIVV